MRAFNGMVLILAAACTGLAGAREPAVRLPDIGSSAATAASPQELMAYGDAMLREMRALNMILDDPLVSDYMQSLGYRLVAFSDRPDLTYTFFVVRSNDINAFAFPSGHIGTNVGLITAVSSEDELAAVTAHEIAHVTQTHTLRAFEDSKKSALPIALAMLGAMVASRNRTDDAGQAALIGGLGLMQQRAINFTRYDEIESDRVGIQTLARAGYDPLAMADTFSMFQRTMRTNGIDIPEFLRTHPVDVNRIADAKARAVQLGRLHAPSGMATGEPAPAATSSGGSGHGLVLTVPAIRAGSPRAAAGTRPAGMSDFDLMRERARTLTADSPTAILRYYADELRENPAADTAANRYGHALALLRAREPGRSVEEFSRLTADFPGQLVFELGLAVAEDLAGQRQAAIGRFEKLAADSPRNRAVALAFSTTLLADASRESARRAQELLRPLLARHGDDPELQRTFARACELGGDKVRATEAYAEATFLNGRAEDALNQLKALSRDTELDYYQRARVDARITALTPIVLEQRKRGERNPESRGLGAAAMERSCPPAGCAGVSLRRNNSPLQ